jgi:hypothetical protein
MRISFNLRYLSIKFLAKCSTTHKALVLPQTSYSWSETAFNFSWFTAWGVSPHLACVRRAPDDETQVVGQHTGRQTVSFSLHWIFCGIMQKHCLRQHMIWEWRATAGATTSTQHMIWEWRATAGATMSTQHMIWERRATEGALTCTRDTFCCIWTEASYVWISAWPQVTTCKEARALWELLHMPWS